MIFLTGLVLCLLQSLGLALVHAHSRLVTESPAHNMSSSDVVLPTPNMESDRTMSRYELRNKALFL